MYTIIPLSAIGSGLSIFIPLYILSANGTVFDVGIAIALYSLVSIPSALFWGRITDKIGRNKPFIVLSLVFTIPIIAMFFLFNGVTQAYIYYAMYAVVATAASPAINILIMGTRKSSNTPRSFGRYSLFLLVGAAVAFLLGVAILTNNLMLYTYFLLGFNIAAIILGLLLIKEHPRKAISESKRKAAHRTYPILNTLTNLPALLLGYTFIEHMLSNLKNKNTKSIYQLMVAIALFNLGFYIFYASFIPFQRVSGLTYSNIFVISLANVLAQILLFIMIIRLKRFNLQKYYLCSITLIGTAYLIAMLSEFFPLGLFYYINMSAYVIVGLSFGLWNLSSAVLLYDKIRGIKEGYYIGVWASFLGGSAVIGSFISGFISSNYGYIFTFAAAALIAIASGMVFATEFARNKKAEGFRYRK
jgi:MFS family permease